MKVSIFMMVLPCWLWSQTPIQVSLFNEATAIPFTKILTRPIHPGLQLGTEFNYIKKTKTRWFQTVNSSYYYHKHLAHGFSIFTEVAYEYRFKWGVALQPMLGVGYLHTFSTHDEFTLINGQYEKKPDRGNARLYSSVALDVGYYINPHSSHSSKIFIKYQPWLEYPFSPGFIPAMTHINLHLGFKFFIP
ncbi:MAG TPA: hypothetical protein VL947_12520 [Cytophagales bacterium]|nr:hypothetical protein [Cytophagales bacterium]